MVEAFRIARYRFDLEAIDQLHMPAYQGSTLRGGFGHAFKQIVCFQPDWRTCTPCARAQQCPYGYIFEARAPADQPGLHHLREIPPPFVIEASSDAPRVYQPGERLGFDVILIGKAIGYLPYFMLAFQELGKAGIGRPAGRYVLQRISAVHPWRDERALVYDGVDMCAGAGLAASWADVSGWAATLPADQLTLHFLTPTDQVSAELRRTAGVPHAGARCCGGSRRWRYFIAARPGPATRRALIAAAGCIDAQPLRRALGRLGSLFGPAAPARQAGRFCRRGHLSRRSRTLPRGAGAWRAGACGQNHRVPATGTT
ncbi:MAG: hypothetical protein U0Z44_03935 [Kouleothrix sp.]